MTEAAVADQAFIHVDTCVITTDEEFIPLMHSCREMLQFVPENDSYPFLVMNASDVCYCYCKSGRIVMNDIDSWLSCVLKVEGNY